MDGLHNANACIAAVDDKARHNAQLDDMYVKKIVQPVYWFAGAVAMAVLVAGRHGEQAREENPSLHRATATLDSIYALYSANNSLLLRENFPYDSSYRADYLAGGQAGSTNPYAYLWPFSGTLSAVSALLEHTKDTAYLSLVDKRIVPALQQYYDPDRKPAAYASYIRAAGPSDRFYDDNIWLGIDFSELYLHSGRQQYLDKATEIWAFVKSGQDSLLGGGVYWCEQKKESKNTCSNAPAVVFALRMFEATKDSAYLAQGREWYAWTKRHLQDPADGLYWDNINLAGRVNKRKYPYNSGQMLQGAVLLYHATNDTGYLEDAKRIAQSGYDYFFEASGGPGGSSRFLKPSNNWFIAVMLRGYVALDEVDGNARYLEAFKQNLDYAWNHGRSANGLFDQDWKSVDIRSRKWLLDQAAMVEMYARIAND
ncbi:glycoside hydrolase family 76 protein [Parapedobacter sp. DT-150]|uniref:glycoside hydrolase family 76 protein n=1 Tax=Parapedobacter sp. DT-150 TaxID=3396162 RepID=UPI003F1A5CEB